MKGVAVLVLRYKRPGHRDFRVPLNFTIAGVEIPLGLALVTAALVALCVINLLTKQVATIAGVSFTLVFFAIFIASERSTKKRATAHAELDQFNLEPEEALTPEKLGVRPGNVLVMVRNYNTLYNLKAVLDRVDPHRQDVVVLHLRFLQRAGSGESELSAEQLFSLEEQTLFTRARWSCRKQRASRFTWRWRRPLRNGMPFCARRRACSRVEWCLAHRRIRQWPRNPASPAWPGSVYRIPKPQLTLEFEVPAGQEHIFYLGPHAPRLTPKEIDLLHGMWLELSTQVAPDELHHHDVVHFALEQLREELNQSQKNRARVGVAPASERSISWSSEAGREPRLFLAIRPGRLRARAGRWRCWRPILPG